MARYSKEYSQLFDYLSADELSDHETGLIVFGRKDLLLARKVLDIVGQDRAKWTIITGGIGKDSGNLQIPESEYLAQGLESQAKEAHITLPPLYTETQATNGGENSRNSLAIMRRAKLDHDDVTAVAHATSARRLGEMLKHAAHSQDQPLRIYRAASDYEFDPSSPYDQKEARDEMLRLADWPEKDWLLPQNDLPEDLVDFARNVKRDDK